MTAEQTLTLGHSRSVSNMPGTDLHLSLRCICLALVVSCVLLGFSQPCTDSIRGPGGLWGVVMVCLVAAQLRLRVNRHACQDMCAIAARLDSDMPQLL